MGSRSPTRSGNFGGKGCPFQNKATASQFSSTENLSKRRHWHFIMHWLTTRGFTTGKPLWSIRNKHLPDFWVVGRVIRHYRLESFSHEQFQFPSSRWTMYQRWPVAKKETITKQKCMVVDSLLNNHLKFISEFPQWHVPYSLFCHMCPKFLGTTTN